MSNAVQQGHNHALLGHGRSNGIHGSIKVIGLTGQQDNIVGSAQLTLLNSLDLRAEFPAILEPNDQAIPLKLGSALGPDEKNHVSAAPNQHSTKISPERTGAQHQVPHLASPMSASW